MHPRTLNSSPTQSLSVGASIGVQLTGDMPDRLTSSHKPSNRLSHPSMPLRGPRCLTQARTVNDQLDLGIGAPGELPSTAVGLFLARQFQRDSSAMILATGWLRHLGLDGSCRTSRHLRAEALYPSQDLGRRIHAWQLGEVTHTPTI
jgi:hypothetical protein